MAAMAADGESSVEMALAVSGTGLFQNFEEKVQDSIFLRMF
jgi:hypothetical protein